MQDFDMVEANLRADVDFKTLGSRPRSVSGSSRTLLNNVESKVVICFVCFVLFGKAVGW